MTISQSPPSQARAHSSRESGALPNAAGGDPFEFGRINVPTGNPGVCQRCSKKHTLDGHAKRVHWSIRAQQWLCLWCHFEAPDAGEKR